MRTKEDNRHMPNTDVSPPRAVLYLRLSALADDSTSIARQRRDLHALAEREGWNVVAEFADEGKSGRVARKAAADAVAMIADNEADVLATWKLDRFTRQGWDGLGEVTRALDARAAEGRPARFVALQDGLSSDSPAFRLVAGVLSEVARSEAENTAARQRSAIAYRRQVGKFTGGTVPFGYRSVPAPDGVGRVLVQSKFEAAIVREVAAALLGRKDSLSGIAASLNERGIYAPRSEARRALLEGESPEGKDQGKWRAASIRNMWAGSEHLTGRVILHGDYVRDENGLPRTVWPPILTPAEQAAIREAVNFTPPAEARKRMHFTADPKRRPGVRAARLLSDVAYCGKCGEKLYVTTSNGRPVYSCSSKWRGAADCGGVTVDADALDDYVSARFLSVAGDWAEVAPVDDSAAQREQLLADIDAAIGEATDRMRDDSADVVALAKQLAALKLERQAVREQPLPPAEPQLTGRTLRDVWESDSSTAWRRAVLGKALDHVDIGPATVRRKGQRLDPERVTFYWNS